LKIPPLSNAAKVASWEFWKSVRTPTFLILTFLIPVLMVVIGGAGVWMAQRAESEGMTLAVQDFTDDFYEHLSRHVMGTPLTLVRHQGGREDLETDLLEGEYTAFIVVDEEILMDGRVPLYVDDIRDVATATLRAPLTGAVTSYRLERFGLDAGQIAAATSVVSLDVRTMDGEEEHFSAFVMPVVVAMALIFSSIFSGQILMYGVIKEKRNRVVEILLSSLSAPELLWGKVMGFGLLGLVQIALWAATAVVVMGRFTNLGGLSLQPGQAVIYLLYFLLGYLLLSSLFAAMGATMKDAEGGSQAQGLVVMIPLAPVFFSSLIIMQPNSLWVRILSHVPPFNITTVLLRMAGTTLPSWEIATTLVALLLSSLLFMRLGARIFAGGLLEFDRTVRIRDLKRMLSRS
jgi:ABC-2 type transport system permease protein